MTRGKVDNLVSARRKYDQQLTERLQELLPEVLRVTGYPSIHSLHGKVGGKNASFMNIANQVVLSPDHFRALWFTGFEEYLPRCTPLSGYTELFDQMKRHKELRDYVVLFLERTYIRNYEALSKNRPTAEEAEIWIGQQNATYGLLVTPVIRDGAWTNDKSEIRHFKPIYWTIGHVLETGLVVPGSTDVMPFKTVEDYLKFFVNVLVRNSGSQHEKALAERFREYVRNSPTPEEVHLLIPEYRYGGLNRKHEYRLDFCILDQVSQRRIGIELSPWSTHGYLSKLKGLSQSEINKMAMDNFAKEMKKHRAYFEKFGITTLIYTDDELADMDAIFENMEPFLRSAHRQTPLNFNLINSLFT